MSLWRGIDERFTTGSFRFERQLMDMSKRQRVRAVGRGMKENDERQRDTMIRALESIDNKLPMVARMS